MDHAINIPRDKIILYLSIDSNSSYLKRCINYVNEIYKYIKRNVINFYFQSKKIKK